ncbi:FadR family transcriptional regulator [Paenalkalicoccus suaedae]|uniref:FadR family transcriptional regulator n=1 Tax=Paenalkalicoccus suaedae TaxID=2592382 RepID=A0A859FGW8_9BACI|nr:FadR/GntR family transcriptional regulator [Paenalkalicoccus suaedae]QKS72040.1 FadR family transcriptional regulator [Paenalkalicoccus suaedae]
MAVTENKVYVRILKEIEQLIMTNDLSAGDKLPSERDLSERLQVGRSSVREALRSLELLDLIETRKGEGTFVKQAGSHRLAEILASFFLQDPRARRDLRETRRMIEVEAVRLACDRATAEEVEELENVLRDSYHVWRDGHIPVEEDILFHKTIVQISQNKLMMNIWRPLVEYSKVALRESLSREGRMEHALEEHESIVEAIKCRDVSRAVDKMNIHLANSQF